MDTLLGQLLLVLSVALVVAAEYEEFGCKFDDEHYNYRDDKNDFGAVAKIMRFDTTTEFKQFMKDLEEIRATIRYKSLYNTVDPFFQMYKDYKDAKERNPATKFADFFRNYKPINPYENSQRFPNSTIFSVISIYRALKTEFEKKYPAFKDSFYLATCDENIDKAVLDDVKAGSEQMRTPRGFEHDRIVGVISFLIRKDEPLRDIRGYIIVESTHLTPTWTLNTPIVIAGPYAKHYLNNNEVQLFDPTGSSVARYKWLNYTLHSYLRIDYVKSDNGELYKGSKELVTRTDLLFMTPKSFCPFVKHVWKNNLLKTDVRLIKDTKEGEGGTRYYFGVDLNPLSGNDTLFTFRKTKKVQAFIQIQPTYHPLLKKYVQPKDSTTSLQTFPLDELNQMSQESKDSLKKYATIFNADYTQLYDILQQMSNIQINDRYFINEFITYKTPPVDKSTFWNSHP